MRDHPEGVRSVILDSTYPTGIDAFAELVPNAERAINAFFDECEQSSCGSQYPDLRGRFYRLLDDLEANPREFVVTDSLQTNNEITILWDADRFVRLVFGALYSKSRTALLPSFIEDFENGDIGGASQDYVDFVGTGDRYFSDGMFRSVQCRERLPFTTREAVEASESDAANSNIGRAMSQVAEMNDCEVWGVPPSEPTENDPISSDIPTLVLAGSIDPITPPHWGEQAAANLPNSTYLLFPYEGHGITPTDCGTTIALAYLNDPNASLPTGCISGLRPPLWD
jgi:pimeloyl-ACP methyl ester carboxylesterase